MSGAERPRLTWLRRRFSSSRRRRDAAVGLVFRRFLGSTSSSASFPRSRVRASLRFRFWDRSRRPITTSPLGRCCKPDRREGGVLVLAARSRGSEGAHVALGEQVLVVLGQGVGAAKFLGGYLQAAHRAPLPARARARTAPLALMASPPVEGPIPPAPAAARCVPRAAGGWS